MVLVKIVDPGEPYLLKLEEDLRLLRPRLAETPDRRDRRATRRQMRQLRWRVWGQVARARRSHGPVSH
jgi:hypothetical protein